MSKSSLLDPVAGDHVVHFYDDAADLLRILASYLRDGLAAGGAGIVIGTAERLADVRAGLALAGEDVLGAEADGRLVLRDADETLAQFEADGQIDAAKFERVVGDLLGNARAASSGGKLHVYGEMVARLWDRGEVPAAIELERLWNDLGGRVPFALLCAYPARILSDPESAESFNEICACHTQVFDGAPELSVDVARRFPAAPYGARLARRFVRTSLEQWGYGPIADDASLVVAELSANAAAYGGTDFTCGVSRIDGRVRIEVGDGSSLAPVMRALDEKALDGRGLHLVDALARSWGWVPASPGKVVWAELDSQTSGQLAG